MTQAAPDDRSLARIIARWIGRLITSRAGGAVASIPPVAWTIRIFVQVIMRRKRKQSRPRYRIGDNERTTRSDLQSTLDGIVRDVVETFGYAMALVSTFEDGDTLPIRALYVDTTVLSFDQIRLWEQQLSQLIGRTVSLSDPQVARVVISDDTYRDNLSVIATRLGHTVVSDSLHDLFVPILPAATRPALEVIQRELLIKQVIAVPFFLETGDSTAERELVGNLFALKRSSISKADINVLSAFGRQAAAAILSERRRLQIQIVQRLIYDVQTGLRDEQQILRRITESMVNDMDYVLAIVTTCERGDILPVRAFAIDPLIASSEQLHCWANQISQLIGTPFSLNNAQVARVFLNREEYQSNLAVVAAREGRVVVSNTIYDLLVPMVPATARQAVEVIQHELGVHQVIAVPFFLETTSDPDSKPELVGSLLALSRSSRFSHSEIELLQTFGQQAAAGLRNARLYRQSEDRRIAAQIFARMAFNATTSIHDLRNQIGTIRVSLQILKLLPTFPENERQPAIDEIAPVVLDRLDHVARLIESLHEPWRNVTTTFVDVNACLRRALQRTIGTEPSWVELTLTDNLPAIQTSFDMLTESFKVLIKNAVEAMAQSSNRRLSLHTWYDGQQSVIVEVRDSGSGIRPEHLARIFDLRWSTKSTGLGFGLFWTKDYIEGLGGMIDVESELDKGTTFRIMLPIPTQPETANQ